MNKHDLVSVVIPTLNTRSQYIKEAIYSIEKQSISPFEIIIVNNGDGEVELPDCNIPIRQVKIVYRAGVAQARNFGVSLVRTPYVAFLDDDDLWAPDYLEGIIRYIKNYTPDCLIGRLDQLIQGKIIPYKNATGFIKKDVILVRNPGITGSSVVVKKEAFLKVGGYNTKLPPSEDKALVLEFIFKGYHVTSVPESQAIIRQYGKENRLTNSEYAAEGIYQFYILYKNKMTFEQRVLNLRKIYIHRSKAYKSHISLLLSLLLTLLLRVYRPFKKFRS